MPSREHDHRLILGCFLIAAMVVSLALLIAAGALAWWRVMDTDQPLEKPPPPVQSPNSPSMPALTVPASRMRPARPRASNSTGSVNDTNAVHWLCHPFPRRNAFRRVVSGSPTHERRTFRKRETRAWRGDGSRWSGDQQATCKLDPLLTANLSSCQECSQKDNTSERRL